MFGTLAAMPSPFFRCTGVALSVCLCPLPGSRAFAQDPADYPAAAEWRQWGGPTRSLQVDATGLVDIWPQEGPPQLWTRSLGLGHSTVIVDVGRLYTQYRPDTGSGWATEERVIALDAVTGETVWEYAYPSQPLDFNPGAGPHASPLVVGGRLFTAGTNK